MIFADAQTEMWHSIGLIAITVGMIVTMVGQVLAWLDRQKKQREMFIESNKIQRDVADVKEIANGLSDKRATEARAKGRAEGIKSETDKNA